MAGHEIFGSRILAPARWAVDLFLPPRCPSCGAMVPEQGLLCQRCWMALAFIGDPLCSRCGLPFDFAVEEESLCAACLAEPPSYDCARALLRYDAAAKRLLLPFKHADRVEAAASYAAWMARAAPELLRTCELIVPVPLHWRRLWKRRYNQAALLARELARLSGGAYRPGLLLRKKATPPQGRLSRQARRRNVAGAFLVSPRHAEEVTGSKLLLVDDVMTTGATLEACASVLKRAGAARVDVLVMARVVR